MEKLATSMGLSNVEKELSLYLFISFRKSNKDPIGLNNPEFGDDLPKWSYDYMIQLNKLTKGHVSTGCLFDYIAL